MSVTIDGLTYTDAIHHVPTVRPYPGAPGFHIATCPTCCPTRGRVGIDGRPTWGCTVWRDTVLWQYGRLRRRRGVAGVGVPGGGTTVHSAR